MTAPPMTTPETLLPPARRPLAARLPLLSLYPAKYRAAYGEEIAAVFAETVQDIGPGTALREWATLAAHAARLRTRLSSTDPAGRIAAGAAPFILAGGAGLNMFNLLTKLFLPDPIEDPGHVGHPAIWTALLVAQTGAWILALLCAFLGRWTPARLLVLLGVLGWVVPALACTSFPGLFIAPYLLLLPFGIVPGTLLLIAPPDAVDLSPRGRNETVLTAAAIAVPMSVLVIPWNASTTYTASNLIEASNAWPAAVMSFAALLHLGGRRPDRLRAAGIALAVLPWMAMLDPGQYGLLAPPDFFVPGITDVDLRYYTDNVLVFLAFLATATLLAVLRRFLRRSRPTDPPETT
ncbi:hypothetical protein P3T37_007060 [Kitasatospora sp. MAA4]|uniref:hypothetical protein n=1 Tax=Kitasatospora sp. MAA4 TaxID=3035093 RepID=UPI002473D8B5|nr:hypothetical protein [Kitasatospora sp. MAA4]MDH6137627.1 hypothetical protein [Kitasatospora sp. MAA4]